MRRLLSHICWIMIIFLSLTVISCFASSDHGLYNVSLIPETEVTDFTWDITFDGNNQPVLTTDYPVSKIRQYGITSMDFSYYKDEEFFCNLEFFCTDGNISFRGYGKGNEVRFSEWEAIVRKIKENGLTPSSVKIKIESTQETKELYFNASEKRYLSYLRYSNDFYFGNGFHYIYRYDENGTLSGFDSTFRTGDKELRVSFDKFGQIKSAYISGYQYQHMTGLFFRDGKTYTVQDLGFSPENLIALAALDDTEAPVDPYLIDAGITDPVFWENVKSYDSDGDGILSAGEVQYITSLDLRNMGIKSLDGIEYFTRLQTLVCDNNEITHLDLSNSKQLSFLICDYNQITSLSVNPESSFKVFSCQHNAYHITSPFDITKLPGKFIPERASSWKGGTLNGTILIADNETVTYYYDSTGKHTKVIECKLIVDDGIPPFSNRLILPEDLNVISAEAFANVNTNIVVIPKNVARIEDNAFADCSDLYSAVFYSTDVEIADNIFGNLQNIDIWCYENSTAHRWALNKNYNVKFIKE